MSDELLTSLLRDVSRSFYLTLRVLPRAVRPQISVAYLLARTTDTVADTQIVPVESRLEALAALRRRILGQDSRPLPFTQWLSSQPPRPEHALPRSNPATRPGSATQPTAPDQALPRSNSATGSGSATQPTAPEQALLRRSEAILGLLDTLDDPDRQRIRHLLTTIISGQELDLKRFNGATAERLIALETAEELDDYTYRVAGCVGEFWTRMCRAHLIAEAAIDDESLLRKGIRFGKGLQLVNILRDIRQDLLNGRCYIPRESLTTANLTPESLLVPENEAAFRPVYNQFLAAAGEHLAAGWEYTSLLPHEQMRLRLGCAWPILIGARTLRRLRRENMLDASRRVKVSRREVYFLQLRSVLRYPWPSAWNRQFRNEI